MRRHNVLSTILFLVILCLAAYMLAVHVPLRRVSDEPIPIPRGASIGDISELLEDRSIIRSALVFQLHAIATGKRARLQSGTYQFPASISIAEVMTILWEGSHQVELWVTIPEGLTVRGIASLLFRTAMKDSARILTLSRDKGFLSTLGLSGGSLEGYLMPDTYRIRPEDTEEQILRRMAGEMQRYLTSVWKGKRSKHQILTMASLVEGETRLPGERSRVAGVYYNRLRIGMLLQADPTVQYIIPDGPRRLFYRDLAIDSPYNTYRYRGLPPGPVNNPGRASIHAALHPESHSFLYFVADGRGGHKFSRTAREHNAAVQQYRSMQNP